jgi:fermentation-respiration switch protein FrsA (DUF1100 family)
MGCNAPFEASLIYFPSRELRFTPSDVGLAYEDVYLDTEDGVRIHAWYVPGNPARKTLLWFHGNAGNIGDRVEYLKVYHDRWQVNQMLVEYRGYGKSGGTLSEGGTYADGQAAVAYLSRHKGLTPGHLILFGRSLGAAIAVQLATESDCAGLMLESPFTSIRDMARTHYPLLGHLVPLRIRYASIDKIGQIKCPVLILHGDRDNIVPWKHGRRLYEAAREPKRFFTIEGAGHNDILMRADESYHRTVRNFIDGSGD